MFVNEISTIDNTLVQRQSLAELQQRAAEERLAHQVLIERRGRREARRGLLARLGELFVGATPVAQRRAAHRHAH